jgi:hypothetical protein
LFDEIRGDSHNIMRPFDEIKGDSHDIMRPFDEIKGDSHNIMRPSHYSISIAMWPWATSYSILFYPILA